MAVKDTPSPFVIENICALKRSHSVSERLKTLLGLEQLYFERSFVHKDFLTSRQFVQSENLCLPNGVVVVLLSL